ncbi:MAG: ATP synthase subunit I [Rugosibacter sp.]|nr:ATP synthase subunit I [Rugosibacter sp.]
MAKVLKVVFLQFAVLLLAALIAGVLGGGHEAISAILGGASYLFPNLFFVLSLGYVSKHGRANAATFFAGELLKVMATVLMLVVVQRMMGLSWLAMLGGLFAVLQANFFAFLLKS